MVEKKRYNFFDLFYDFVKNVSDSFSQEWFYTSENTSNQTNKSLSQMGKYEGNLNFESHNYVEICLCVNGSFAIEFEDTICDLNEGEVCLIFPSSVHREHSLKDGNHEAIWVLANIDTISIMLTGKRKEDNNFYIDWACSFPQNNYTNEVFADLKVIKNEFKYQKVKSEEYIKAIMLQILIDLLRSTSEITQKDHSINGWRDTIVEEIKAYIEDNYALNFKLSDISQKMCISPNYLNTIFKSLTGRTIIRYADETRIVKAKWFLKETDYSISRIASMLGFCDQYHFSKSFKKETGYTPTDFRQHI